ncbi:hypothetical protein FHR72_002267 [Mycolicibacterium iranicum]|uniref:Uncharacterized protein n=1 Tax=Mycolicibacterium iranicum TaxID=912594 RepID=A0A839Q7H2_MYCIR|nr:hypothetical protein [Mycolicibacterium iranicum]MBB2990794.1 hypothetical protein [Mycolicibacterium iranicum]
MANASGVAYAGTESETSSSADSNDADAADDQTGAPDAPDAESDGTDVETPGDEPDEDVTVVDPSETEGDVDGGDDAGSVGGGEDTGGGGTAPEVPETDSGEELPTTPSEVTGSDTGTPTDPAPDSGATTEPVDEQTTTDLDDAGDPADVDIISEPTDTVGVTDIDPVAAEQSDTVVPTASAQPEASENVGTVDVLSAVVSSVLAPFTDPATPAPAPWFDALLAWVRRQITHTFFNESPEWGPVTAQQLLTGQVVIDLNAVDPNGDPLTFKIIQPAHGVVLRDPITGNFVYTPTSVVTGAPLIDSFKVVISDSSEHLKGLVGVVQGVFHFLARAIGLAERDEVTLMIPVTVNPIVQMAPVLVVTPVGTGTAGDPIKVSPVVVITDLDSQKLTSATVTLNDPGPGQVLGYGSLPAGVTATYSNGVLTFTGAATVAAYRDLLASVTLTAPTAAIKTVSFQVVDDQNKPSLPAVAVITVLGLPVEVPPLVIVSPAAVGVVGAPVKISPIVVITDLDSDEISSATVSVDGFGEGDAWAYGPVPPGILVTTGAGSLTFTGSASVAAYEQLLQSVTLTSAAVGLKSVSFTVVDSEGNQNIVPAATVITVLGLPVELPPLVIVSPVAAGGVGAPVTISPVVVITDLDSDEIGSATVTVKDATDGDVLGWGSLPDGFEVSVGAGSVTFTGAASAAVYRQILQSVTLTSTSAGLKSVTFTVTDAEGNANTVPAGTVITVLGLPVQVPPLVIVSPVAAGGVGAPVTISPIVVITDLDSDEIGSATVTVKDATDGDVLGWGSLPDGFEVSVGAGSVTFTGAASAAVYRQILQSVTLTSTSAGLKSVTFTVTDAEGNENAVPAGTLVTVVGVPNADLAPVVVVSPVAAGLPGQPITVSPVVVITDLDSGEIRSATVTVNGAAAGDEIGYGDLPAGFEVTTGAGTVTFTGNATAAVYQQLLQSVTLTSTTAGFKSVSFSVTDAEGNKNTLPAVTLVTVVGAAVEVPPLVIVTPASLGGAGQPVTISPIVVITDLDSDIGSATVTVKDAAAGDVLNWGDLPDGFEVSTGTGSVTFTGAASAAVYQQILQSVTLTSSTAGLKSVSFVVTDVDGNANAVPAGTVVTVMGATVEVPPSVIVSPAALGAAGQPVTISPIVVVTDLDSEIGSATVTVEDTAAGDVLGWGELPDGFEVSTGTGSVTFTGAASAAVYQQILQSVTLTSSTAGLKSVSFTVVDVDGNANAVPAGTVVTVVGATVEVPPLVIVSPAALGGAGQPVTISPIVVITDLDSEIGSATVTVKDAGAGDVLTWGELPDGFEVSTGTGSVTFTGAATAAVYQQILQSVTLTSSTAGLKSVSFTVTDVDGNANAVPAGTVVTVVGATVAVPPLVIVSPAALGAAGQPVTISPIVVITDLDSDIGSATVTVKDVAAGDVLNWGELPDGFEVSTGAGSVTFTGAASAAVYQQILQSITLTSSTAGLKSVSFTVTDVDGNANAVPAGTVVTVVGTTVEVPPLVIVSPAALGAAGQPVAISPIVVITDLDSDIGSATVTVKDAAAGDVLNWGELPGGFEVSTGAGSVTFTGAASAAVYQQILQSVTLTSTSAGLKSVSFVVTDVDGNANAVPAGTVVTVVGGVAQVPPLVIVSPAALGGAGQPVTISPIVVITDLDSEIGSATVTVKDAAVGDVLNWGELPDGFEVSTGAGSVTFTGAASAAVYQQILQSVTLTSTSAGLKSVSFVVTDVDGNANAVPAGTVVTVVGAVAQVPPLVIVSPAALGGAGQPVTVSPIVVVTDLDSEIGSATVTVRDPAAGDVLNWGELPDGFEVSTGTGSVTFTGAASAAVYQQILQSVTLTSSTAGLKSVSFTVTDVDGNTNAVPASTVVTVVGTTVEVPPLVIVSPAALGGAGQPVTISPIVVVTDLDSEIGSATVTVKDPAAGDVLNWGELPDGFEVSTGTGSVTFTGAASAAVYQQILQSVTLTSSTAGLKSVSFVVTDVDGNANAVPAGTVVTVVGTTVEVPPLVIVTPASLGGAGQPVTISPIVVITDVDSDIGSATVTVKDASAGDVLGWGELPDGFEVSTGAGSITFTGAASAAVYQQILQSVTLTSSTAGLKSVSFTVTDVDGNANAVPAGTVVTVVGATVEVPPLVIVSPAALGGAGQPVTISPIVVITDLDSEIGSATVTVKDASAGDVLGWGDLPDGFEVSTGAGSVTFTGPASAAVYQQILQSVTLTSSTAGLKSVSFTVTDVDGNANAVPAGTVVTVVGATVEVPPLVIVSPAALGGAGQPVTISPIVVVTDLDSEIGSATVTVKDPAAGDVLNWGDLPDGFEVSTGAGSVTFTGAATAAVYQQILQSVTLTSSTAGLKSVSFTVTDVDGNANAVPAGTVVTVVGATVEVPPLVIVSPAALGAAGQPVAISPIVVITDLDSDIGSATVTVKDAAAGDVLNWGELPDGFEVSTSAGSVTFTGAATAAVYQQILQSVTLTSSTAGLKSVSFTVTDVDGNANAVPAGTVVTVVGAVVQVPPLVIVSPAALGGAGQPVTISPIVVITDLDSEIGSATVTVKDPAAGDVLNWGELPDGFEVSTGPGSVTFTGAASAAVYQQILQSVTLTSSSSGLKSVSFMVTDVDGNANAVPAGTVVTVVGAAVEVPPLIIVSPAALGAAGQPVTISPIVVVTDLDSDIGSATVTVKDAASGDVLNWGELPDGFEVSTGVGSVTFTGAASAAVYQQILQSVTLTSSTAGLKSVSFVVTDVDGNANAVPAGTVVTVVGAVVQVPPLVIVSPAALGGTGQPVTISPIVVITDLDSDSLQSATVTVKDAAAGDVLGWGELPDGFEVSTSAGSVTFTGAATAAVYQQILQSVTLTSSTAGLKSVSFTVTDVDGNANAVPAGTVVTVVGAVAQVPPLVIVSPAALGAAGQSITISPIVVITDLDSEIGSATVTVKDPAAGDVLNWGELPDGFDVSVGTGSVTFTGAASAAVYQQILQSVTLTSTSAGLKSVSFVVTDVDGNANAVPAGTVVTVGGATVAVPPLVIVSPVALGAAGQPIAISPVVVITDLDSDALDSATVTIDDPAIGDVLSWGGLPDGVTTVGFDSRTGSVTFTGAASAAVYQQILQSVTLTSTGAGLKSVSFTVIDADGNENVVSASTVVTVAGVPVEVPPLVVVSPAAVGAAGQPVTISPIVVITDLDSEIGSATVTVKDAAVGDVLNWGELPDGFEVSTGAGSVTFTGAASAAVYQQILQSVTLTSSTAGLKSVSFVVTDVDGNANAVPAGTVVTVVGAVAQVPPLVIASPAALGGAGQPVTISPIVVITDLDSEIGSATVTVKDAAAGDVLNWGELPDGFEVSTGTGSVTFTGAASAAVYQQILQSVTLTSSTAGLKSVSFTVTDVDGNANAVPAGTVVTIVGAVVQVPPLVIVSPAALGGAGQPVTVSPVVVVTDLDSEIGSATVTVKDAAAGDVLNWGELPDGFEVSTGTGSVTFTGAASAAVYQQILQSVTLTSSTAGLKSVSFVVTDVDGIANAVPAGTVVTVVGAAVEVPPLVIVSPAAVGGAGQPIAISPIVVITDLDSDALDSATVTIDDPAIGDVLSWGGLPDGVTTVGFDSGTGSVTFTGAASAAVYQQILQSVTLTSTGAGLKSVSFTVIDADGNENVVSASTVVTVAGVPVEVPPLVVVSPAAVGGAGQPVTISPIVVITDLDSDSLQSATVTVNDPAAGDVLNWGSLPTGFEVSTGAGSVTFTGAASAAVYQQILQSVTLTSSTSGLKSVSFVVTDVDGNANAVPAGTVVTVVGAAVEVPPLVIVSPAALGAAGQPITISPIVVITDLDSDSLQSATVTADDPAAGDVLNWGSLPTGFGVSTGAGSVTFTGAASAAVYQQILQSVTLTSSSAGLKSVSFKVVDADGNENVVSASTVVTVAGVAVEVPPLVVVSPAAVGAAGQPITISPIVVITDLDSDSLQSATVTVDDPAAGDVLNWGSLPTGLEVSTGAGSVTFTGAASAAVYQQILQSVTLTSTGTGLKSVSFTVIDADGNASTIPAGTVVTVVGAAVEVPPLVVVSPAALGAAGQPITISPIVVITDLDSDSLQSATVTVNDPAAGDVLNWGSLPTGFEVSTGAGSVTFTGAASAAVYQQILQSVTLTSSSAGLKSVSFTVVDADGNENVVSASTVVTVAGVPVEVPPLVIVSPAAVGGAGQPIAISPIVVITDLDSDSLQSATVTVDDPAAGDVLNWGSLPTGFEVSTGAGSVTFTGAASAAVYQQILQSVTLTSTGAGLKSVSFTVVDADGNENVVSASTVVTVAGVAIEVSPLVVVSPAAVGAAGQPVTISPVVVITDLDSAELQSATVTVDDPAAGDVLNWGSLPTGFGVSTGAGSVTFTGAASAAVYQQILQSVTLTSTGAGLKSVSFTVVDADGNENVVSASTVVTVAGVAIEVPPLVVVSPAAVGAAGQPVTISPVVVITDLDSAELQSATVTVDDPAAGDVLNWGSLPAGFGVATGNGSVTFTGAASAAVYQQILQSITLTSTGAGLKSVSFTVIDAEGNASSVPAATVVTVVGAAVAVPPLVVVSPAALGAAGQPVTISPIVVITDLDSAELQSATVTIDDPAAGDVLNWGSLPTGFGVSTGNGSVTFTGAASAAVYQQILQSITLTSTGAGLKSVSFTVIDAEGNASTVPAATVVTVMGAAVAVPPLVVVSPAAVGAAGQPITISPIVVITGLDSDSLQSATVTVDDPAVGDVLNWGSLPTGFGVSTGSGSVTFTGAASAAVYQQILQSVTLTSSSAGLKSVSFTVIDAEGNASTVPAATVVTVVGVPGVQIAPVVVVAAAAAGTTGESVTVSPIVVITDLDSEEIQSATVTVSNPGAGDVLGWGTVPTGFQVTTGTGTVTFTGVGSVAVYQQLLESVTLTSTSPGLKTVSFTVTDDQGKTSVVPAATVVTVVGVPGVQIAPVVVVAAAAAGTTGESVTVSPIMVITDLDSEEIQSATVTVSNPGAGDVLGWGTVPTGFQVTTGTGTVTFTGVGSVAVYQQLLESVTLTSTSPGLKTVSFTVTDDQGKASVVPAATVVTVIGLSAVAPIVLTSVVSVSYTAGAGATPVDAGIIVLDGDSAMMSGATVTITDPVAGDALTWGTLPTGVSAEYNAGVLTFDGDATVSQYQQLLRTVAFSTNSTALSSIRMISFTVTDAQLNSSASGSVAVTVVSVPVLATPVVVTTVANVSYTAGATATTVDPNLTLLDADSSQISKAVVSVVGGATAGEILGFTPQSGISGNYSGGVLTFEGTASLSAYQQILRSVTFTTSSGALATIKSISFVVTDVDGKVSAPGLVAVTVVSAPLNVAPLVITSGVNLTYTAGTSAVAVDSNLGLLDLDSSTIKGATVKITGNFSAGDTLTYSAQQGITGTYDGTSGTLTFTGDASVADYQQLLRSVKIATSSTAPATFKTVSFTVTDQQNSSSLPGSVTVTVLAAPVNLAPLVTTVLGPIYTAGNTAVQVNPLLTVLDLDSSTMQGASVAITGNFVSGDVLGFTPVSGIVGNYNSATGVLTFTGTAATATYQQLLQSVTFASGASGSTDVKTVTFTVTDALGATSPNATALVTQTANSAPVLTAPLGGGVLLLGAQVVSPTAVILDDSSYLNQAVVTITNVQSVDNLTFTPVGNITGNYVNGVLTLSGEGTVAQYQEAIRSVRFSKTGLNLLSTRTVTMVVRDFQGVSSNTTTGLLTLVL